MITCRVNKQSLENVIKYVERSIAKTTAVLSENLYNKAISFQVRWSGTYRASWQVKTEGEMFEYLPHPHSRSGKPDIIYASPNQISVRPNYNSPYAKMFVADTASHAYQVEYEGTPRHHEPWMIANHSVNEAIAKFRVY